MELAGACRIIAAAAACATFFCGQLSAMDWKPVEPQELAQKKPLIDSEADAEAIFWEVRVMDEAQSGQYPHTVFQHYLRIKIFNERGRDSQSKVDLPYTSHTHVSAIAGRTIKSDGSIVELKKDAIFDRVLVKGSGVKVRVRSFVLPSVEPGSIIEYRWREDHGDQVANYVRLPFQREIPVQRVTYFIKPLVHPYFPYSMRYIGFSDADAPFKKEADGYLSTTQTKVPAFKEEPHMPPETQVRPWMLIYYEEDRKLTPEKYWQDKGKSIYQETKQLMKVNDEVKRLSKSLTENAKSPEDQVQQLFLYCRDKIKNTADSDVSAEQRAALKENKNPSDTLRQKMGSSGEINLAFAALAIASGFDARLARLSDRGRYFFSPDLANSYFLNTYDIAVKVGDKWRFYDPSNRYISSGMLRWQEEGVQALVGDPKELTFVRTPIAPATANSKKRYADFKLSEDGTLEGDVVEHLSGHEAEVARERLTGQEAAEREEEVRSQLKEQYPGVEVSAISFDEAASPDKPLAIHYHLKVPGYAQRTGKRLFLQPSFFEYRKPAVFLASTRKFPIYFQYPWSESDSIRFEWPAGYALDNAENRPPISFGKVGGLEIKMSVKDGHILNYTRNFSFGADGTILLPVDSYPSVKKAFDIVRQADDHLITLKQGASEAQKAGQ